MGSGKRPWFDISLGLGASVLLLGMVLLTFADVIGRYVFNSPLRGAFEITELALLSLIFAGLPLVSLRSEHVVFDSLDPLLGRLGRRVLKGAVNLLCAAAMLGLAWLMWRTGNDFASSGETTAQLRIPKYPFIYGMSVLCAVTGLVHVANAVSPPPQDDVEGGAL